MDLHRFDFAWHATYAAYWLPTPAASLGLPCVWGPVGGGVTAPRALWPGLGLRGLFGELVDCVAVRLMACLPPTRRTWRGATMPVVQNHQTLARLPGYLRRRAVVLNHAVFAEIAAPWTGPRGRTVVFAGRLEARKAPWLAIRALAYAPAHVHLLMIGDGPDRRRLVALARRLGVEPRVTFAGQLARPAVLQAWKTAAAAVFTGVREEGGIALAEAIGSGTPVIVLAHGGALTVAESLADPSRVSLIEPQSADVTARAIAAAMTRFVNAPPEGDAVALERQWDTATEAATIAASAMARHREATGKADRIEQVTCA
jgi:glycosyltransferase involved in cell wall biosynthesis